MILGLESHQRITLGAAAKVLEETILTSYVKGGKAASPTDAASKLMILATPGQHSCNTRTSIPTTSGQTFL